MRSIFLLLSRLNWLRKWVETSSVARPLASRFIAGETLEEALAVAKRLNTEGIAFTLDHLGESVTTLEEAAAARDVYLRTMNAVHGSGLSGNVSLKLTQFGLDIDKDACRTNVEVLVRRAGEIESFVRIDMESSAYTSRTLALASALHRQYRAVGVVIQASLYRSRADIESLCASRIQVRLCKGAYLEPPDVAYQRKADVDGNFVELMRLLLDRGEYPAIATHDERIIDACKKYVAARSIPRDGFEFQMLYGIRRDLQTKLVGEGYRVRLYVPFGRAWYPYYMRRLAERPANVLFILRNLFR